MKNSKMQVVTLIGFGTDGVEIQFNANQGLENSILCLLLFAHILVVCCQVIGKFLFT
jgi:hypothetical protein